MNTTTSAAIIRVLDDLRVNYGDFRVCRFDGAKYHVSAEFQNYLKSFNCEAELTSAYNSQSAGGHEIGVKRAKKILVKYHSNWEQFRFALRNENAIPRSTSFSPAQLFFQRNIITNIPQLPWKFKPKDYSIGQKLKRENLLESFSRINKPNQKNLSVLQVDDPVMIQDHQSKKWLKSGKVVKVRSNKKSYYVELDDGTMLLRNRRFLRPHKHH